VFSQQDLREEEKVDVRLINPFIDATLHVLKMMASVEAKAGKPYIKKTECAAGDVSAVIGLTGEANGTISITFPAKSIMAIVSKMFGETITRVDGEVSDAVGEIANMISGQARQKLEKMGRVLHGAIPSVIMGKDHQIKHISSHPIVAVPFESDDGGFTIEVCIEE